MAVVVAVAVAAAVVVEVELSSAADQVRNPEGASRSGDDSGCRCSPLRWNLRDEKRSFCT